MPKEPTVTLWPILCDTPCILKIKRCILKQILQILQKCAMLAAKAAKYTTIQILSCNSVI